MKLSTLTPGRIGLGTYRMSIRSKEHKSALLKALEQGCKLIDTAANYTNGESEQLIGETLVANPDFNPYIISKAGYIQGYIYDDLEKSELLDKIEKCEIEGNSYHSIDPKFLQFQINHTLKSLQREKLDLFLLHNPEYMLKSGHCSQEEYYQKLHNSFTFLEDLVAQGIIDGYGISSNTFAYDLEHPHVTRLDRIVEILDENSFSGFHAIQFPFNFLEIGAMERRFDQYNLIQFAKENGIITIANRPLNAFTDQGLLRIAEYDQLCPAMSVEDAKKHFDIAMEIVEKKYFERLKAEGEKTQEETLWDVPFFAQFKKIWLTMPTPDAVEQIYYENLFPLLAQIWGDEGVPPEESSPFFALFDISMNFARQNMHGKAQIFKKQAMSAGLIDPEDKRDLTYIACHTYLGMGVDFVLVGAKRSSYVDQLSELF